MNTLFCPSCGAENPLERSVCQKCKADLGVVKSILDTANLHYNRALTLAGEGRYPEAELEATAALELYNKNPRYHNLLGTIYARQGKFNRAQEAWETTLYLEEDTSSAYRSLQRLHRLQADGKLEPAPRRHSSIFDVLLLMLLVLLGWMAHEYRVGELKQDFDRERDAWQTAQLAAREAPEANSAPVDERTAMMEESLKAMQEQSAAMKQQTEEMRRQYERLWEQMRRDRLNFDFMNTLIFPSEEASSMLRDVSPQTEITPSPAK